jgi:hypothetical protein
MERPFGLPKNLLLENSHTATLGGHITLTWDASLSAWVGCAICVPLDFSGLVP